MSTELAVLTHKTLSEILSTTTEFQKSFLILKALGSDDHEAKRITGAATSTHLTWKTDERFTKALAEIYNGNYRAEAIEMFLDVNLPSVLGELLLICKSGMDGERPHKDKERAIEFYLKELCGVSKHVEKSMSIAQILMQVQSGQGFPRERINASE